jgi:hypothetical protein
MLLWKRIKLTAHYTQQVENHFIAEFAIIDHEHEISKQHLLRLEVVVLSDPFLDRRDRLVP